MSTRRTRVARRLAVAKDIALFTLGLTIIYRQGWLVAKDDFNWLAMAFGGMLTQAPGVMAWISLRHTAEQSSPSVELPPSPLPLLSLPASSDDET